MSAMGTLPCRFFPWPGNMGGTLLQVLALFLLFVNDFLIVGNVSWIRHALL